MGADDDYPGIRKIQVMKPFWTVTIFALGAIATLYAPLLVRQAVGQSGTRSSGAQQGSGNRPQTGAARPAAAPFDERFWQYLRELHYENWAPFPGTDGDFTEGQSPHGAFVKSYINRLAAGNPKDPAAGSIVVKENYGKDKKTLMAITVMYRSKDYDPEHGDWYWIKYEPDGRTSQMQGMKVAGRVSMCSDCHSQANGSDYLFSNDDK